MKATLTVSQSRLPGYYIHEVCDHDGKLLYNALVIDYLSQPIGTVSEFVVSDEVGPTESESAWRQGNGRGRRVAPGKTCVWILDHVGGPIGGAQDADGAGFRLQRLARFVYAFLRSWFSR